MLVLFSLAKKQTKGGGGKNDVLFDLGIWGNMGAQRGS